MQVPERVLNGSTAGRPPAWTPPFPDAAQVIIDRITDLEYIHPMMTNKQCLATLT